MYRTHRITIDVITNMEPGEAFEKIKRAIEDNVEDSEIAAGYSRDLTADEPLIDYDLACKDARYCD